MKPTRQVNRRSFLHQVAGGAALGGTLGLVSSSEAFAVQVTDCDSGAGADPGGRGTGRRPRTGVTDSDSGAAADPGGCGRGGTRSTDPGSHQQQTGYTDSDPTDRVGSGRGGTGSRQHTGVTDRDSGAGADPAGSGRGGGTTRNGGGSGSSDAYQTGRYERRYEVCWVDHPSRTNDECNLQIYSEWQTVWSDGRVEYDAAEAHRRHAEMTGRGYTARWHRMLVNEWVGGS